MGGQSTVNAGGQSVAIAGQLGDAASADVFSGFVAASGIQVPFGYGVSFNGANERGFGLPTGFSGVVPIDGVNLFGYNHAPAGAADGDGVYQGDIGGSGLLTGSPMDVLQRGQVWLPVENNITRGQRGWCRGIATGTLGQGVWAGVSPGQLGPSGMGMSYHVDASKAVKFITGVYVAADGTTNIALAEVDFQSAPY